MKNSFKILVITCFMLVSFMAYGQSRIAVLDYMKVEPGKAGNYLEVEKEWNKIHQARVDAGIILYWELFEKVFSGADDPYHFITVAIFDDFTKTENPFVNDLEKIGMTQEEVDELMKRTGDSRTMVKTEVYHFVNGADGTPDMEYLIFNKMKVKQGKGEDYTKMEEEVFKPVHQESINRGFRSGWSLWARWPNPDTKFQFVTVDSYSSYGQWMEGEDLLSEVHPDMSWKELGEKVNDARKNVGSEIWRLVDIVPAREADANQE